MDITPLLVNAQSADPAVRNQAEEAIQQLQQGDQCAPFWVSCAGELANNDKPTEVRQLAGLILKNALDAKDDARRKHLQEKWVALPAEVKQQVKVFLLTTLACPVKIAAHTAAQVVAKVAAIEIPLRAWNELLGVLMQNMTQAGARQATLEALGYMCEDLDPQHLQQPEVDQVLTAVVQGIASTEPDIEVRLAATNALLNALDFVEGNFEKDHERSMIVQVTCEATQCPQDARIRQCAFECLVYMHQVYYRHMSAYIQEVFNISVKAMREDEEDVALQAIELWTTLVEVELDEDDADNKNLVKQALPGLVPVLLETLTKQEDGQDMDENAWNLSTAGGTCLGSVATLVTDDIVPIVAPFIQMNATNEDWHLREAALLAFGSILDGPKPEILQPMITSALPLLMQQLKDPSSHIKDTTAWTLGQAVKFVPEVVNDGNLPQVLSELLQSLADPAPHVAKKVCWCIGYVAAEKEKELTPYFTNIIQTLLQTAERPDAETSGLRRAAFDALETVVDCTADTMPMVSQLLQPMMQKLTETLAMPASTAEERQRQADQQSLYCGVLQTIIHKLSEEDTYKAQMIANFADPLMVLFLQVLACQTNSVQEDAMGAIGAMVNSMEKDFLKYMEHVYPFLDKGLKNFQEYEVCKMTVGVLGDICREMGSSIPEPTWNQIVWTLLESVGSDQLHRSVKPAILSCFGDIALTLDLGFKNYLQVVMTMLDHASKVSLTTSQTSDDEELEHINLLRQSILEAYAGILQSMSKEKVLLQPYAEGVLNFVAHIVADSNTILDEVDLCVALVGVLGDLAKLFEHVGPYVMTNHQQVAAFVVKCTTSESEQLRSDAAWAKANLEKQVGTGQVGQ